MEANRKQAYAFLLSAALLHLKWDLAAFWRGLDWRPWRLLQESRRIRKAAHRACAFHNLAIFLTWDMHGFSEDLFWRDIERFMQNFPGQDWTNYRRMFDRKLAGEEVFIIKPGG
jgi:hypothetical protein